MARHIHLHMHDYGPGQNPASHKGGGSGAAPAAPKREVKGAHSFMHSASNDPGYEVGHYVKGPNGKHAKIVAKETVKPGTSWGNATIYARSRWKPATPESTAGLHPSQTRNDVRDYGPGQNPASHTSHGVAQSKGWTPSPKPGAMTTYTHPDHPGHTLEINTKAYRTNPKDNPKGQGEHGWIHQGPTTATVNPKAGRHKHVKHGASSGELSKHLSGFHGS